MDRGKKAQNSRPKLKLEARCSNHVGMMELGVRTRSRLPIERASNEAYALDGTPTHQTKKSLNGSLLYCSCSARSQIQNVPAGKL